MPPRFVILDFCLLWTTAHQVNPRSSLQREQTRSCPLNWVLRNARLPKGTQTTGSAVSIPHPLPRGSFPLDPSFHLQSLTRQSSLHQRIHRKSRLWYNRSLLCFHKYLTLLLGRTSVSGCTQLLAYIVKPQFHFCVLAHTLQLHYTCTYNVLLLSRSTIHDHFLVCNPSLPPSLSHTHTHVRGNQECGQDDHKLSRRSYQVHFHLQLVRQLCS